jgi:hypothetical protein
MTGTGMTGTGMTGTGMTASLRQPATLRAERTQTRL